ncbi:MAG: hypothetical protein ACK5S3_17700, partial [Pirellulaceae bacterium]
KGLLRKSSNTARPPSGDGGYRRRVCYASHRTQLVHHLAMVATEEGIAAQVIEHSSSTIWRWWLTKKGLLRKSSNTAHPPSGDGG